MRYTPWVVSEHSPDFSSLESMLKDGRFRGKSGQDLAVELWKLMVDRDLGIFHYLPAREGFRKGQDVYDALQTWNVYGFTICHCHAHILAAMGRAAGFETRIACIRGHEGTEFFYDGGWHYFDGDIQMFHRRRSPRQKEIASRQDIYEDLSLVDRQDNPSNPYMFPDRLPEIMRPLYSDPPHYLPVIEESMHSMDFRLRPGESMTRYFRPMGRWVVFDNYPALFRQYCSAKDGKGPTETGPEGPAERFWPWRRYGNGFLHYAPRIGSGWTDLESGADSLENIEFGEDCARASGDTASVMLPFESPYVICGIGDPLKRCPASDGAAIKAKFRLPDNTSVKISVQVYDPAKAGQDMEWTQIWSSEGKTGLMEAVTDYSPLVDGLYRFKLRIEMSGRGAELLSLSNTLWFMVSPHSLPRLKRIGENKMKIHHGDKFGLPTRSFMFERWMEGNGSLPNSAFSAENLLYKPDTYSKILPEDPGKPWKMIVEVNPPRKGTMQWLSAFATVEGIRPGEEFDGTKSAVEVAERPEGPWKTIAETYPQPHPQGWHSTIFGSVRLSGKTEKAYVRFSGKKGMNLFRIAGHYSQENAKIAEGSLVVGHYWFEDDPAVGRRLRSHSEKVAGTEHEYSVHCASEPHDDKIVLSVPSVGRR